MSSPLNLLVGFENKNLIGMLCQNCSRNLDSVMFYWPQVSAFRPMGLFFTFSDRKEGMPKLIPLFITVDPDRDKPANLKEYLSGTITSLSLCIF